MGARNWRRFGSSATSVATRDSQNSFRRGARQRQRPEGRELYEETGLRAQIGSLLGVLDRRDKDAITLLFVAVPNKNSIKIKQNNKEIESADFQASLPKKASPSAKYFWSARRGPVKKVRKIRASTHQFPAIV